MAENLPSSHLPLDPADTRLIDLATSISKNTALFSTYLASAGLPMPSFAPSAPIALPLPASVETIRELILDAATELSELILGPRETMVDWQFTYYIPLHFVSHYKLAEAFPIESTASFNQIATATGLSEALVRRLLRHAISNRIFIEVSKGVIAHTATSALLATDKLFQDYVATGVQEMLRATTYTIPAMERWPAGEELGQTAFSLMDGDEPKPFYDIVGGDPARAQRFMNTMAMRTKGPGYSVEHIASDRIWEELPVGGKVVDLGGSHGEVAVAIARRNLGLSFVVQDLQNTIKAHPPVPEDLASRMEFMAHDFFAEQPVREVDAILLRWVLHNWPDKYCLQILRGLRGALKDGANVIVHELCLPEPNSTNNRLDRRLRSLDMTMLMLFNSQERDLDEWIDLFRRADPRFTFVRVTHPEGSNLDTLIFEWTAGQSNS